MALKKETAESESSAPLVKCSVCEAPCLPVSYLPAGVHETLCWVCRRLKISAWRDADLQSQPAGQE
ncbi:MAG: hypothetical protein K2X03_12290 [Bryobacteraceae bacterium]|nr:hypothetical protein [Bryobacteraceae bacterium]